MLRCAAEAVKQEIYRYRCRVENYGDREARVRTRDEELAARVEQITCRMLDADVLQSSLLPYEDGELPPRNAIAPDDDGFSRLTPETYIDWRLDDQKAYLQRKSLKLDRHRRLQWTIAELGGVGTFLAAVGQEIWIPVSVALGAALTSYLEQRSREDQDVAASAAGAASDPLVRSHRTALVAIHNAAVLRLENIKTWWLGLGVESRGDVRFSDLVRRTETVLQSDVAQWAGELQETLAEPEVTDRNREQRAERYLAALRPSEKPDSGPAASGDATSLEE